MPLPAGSRLGPYEVLSALGAGGMGEVYKGRDTRLGRIVALKILPAEYASNSDRRAAFEREARAVAALSHPNICTLFDVGRDHDMDFLVMEYIDGETLSDRIASHRERLIRAGTARPTEPGNDGLPLADVLRIATDIADALAAAHQAGVVHRDLKPGNVMITTGHGDRRGSLEAKVLDFGLAKFARPQDGTAAVTQAGTTFTQVGTLVGTLPYMAPEQLAGQPIDSRTDLFALGAIVYEMVSGRRPFQAPSDASLIAAILRDEPPPLAAAAPGTPSELQRLVSKCLTKNPDERWQSAADAADALRWLSRTISIDSRGVEPGDRTHANLQPPAPRARAGLKRTSPQLMRATTIALLLALIAAGYEWSRSWLATQAKQTAVDLCYSMKDVDVRVAALEQQAAASGNGPSRIQGYSLLEKRDRQNRYDEVVARLSDKKMNEQDRLVLRVTRLFGECEVAAPPTYLRDVQQYIAKWQQSGLFATRVKLSADRGMTRRVASSFIAQDLPPQYYYVALVESGFNVLAIGPSSRSGIPKGMWQLAPGIAQAYGLQTGARTDKGVVDAADERFNWERDTDAASRYIKELYATETQASGLLVMAAYHWGGDRILDVLRTLPADPRQRNFWQLASKGAIPFQTYDYVLNVVSAAVIGENPRLFGYDMDSPLKGER